MNIRIVFILCLLLSAALPVSASIIDSSQSEINARLTGIGSKGIIVPQTYGHHKSYTLGYISLQKLQNTSSYFLLKNIYGMDITLTSQKQELKPERWHYFGIEKINTNVYAKQHKTTLSTIKAISKQANLNVNTTLESISDIGFGSGKGFSMDLGVIYDLSNGIKIGTQVRNLAGVVFWNRGVNDILLAQIGTGLSMQLSEAATLYIEALTVKKSIQTGFGIDFRPNSELIIRLGSSESLKYNAGFTYNSGFADFHYSIKKDAVNSRNDMSLLEVSISFDDILAKCIRNMNAITDSTPNELPENQIKKKPQEPNKPSVNIKPEPEISIIQKQPIPDITARKELTLPSVIINTVTTNITPVVLTGLSAIVATIQAQSIEGKPGTSNFSSTPITRAEFAQLLAFTKECNEKISLITTPNIIKFRDIPDTYWAKQYIEKIAAAKITSGFEDDTFRPEEYLTNVQMLAMIILILDIPNNPAPIKFISRYPVEENWMIDVIRVGYNYHLFPEDIYNYNPNKLVEKDAAKNIIKEKLRPVN
ncbi:MAG: hypothetical protein A2X42_10620 [Candidatus Margulisbacteria bacterium GWF2_38_17]|nr:MAG: hypothetical protein A2X42_10620 [Candidatus Margulisbacteria bacterium GWF2_38_17]